MITIRRSSERGFAEHGWLKSWHTFSFADYYDPEHMGFRVLRVINEDIIEPGMGFPTHAHRNMEIITYIIKGALEHKDSMGNTSIIRPGEIQRMSAGRGVQHSEYNSLKDQQTHLLQIWILPEEREIEPGYEQKSFVERFAQESYFPIATKTGRDGSIRMHQDAKLYVGRLGPGRKVTHSLKEGRHAWIQVVSGSLEVEKNLLNAGDGAAVSQQESLNVTGKDQAEFLLFDLP